ncbi:MAG: hypothetical protein M3Q22_15570 [Actinomycetota bacterium]|nr:hypothetical protein [Actinomycetota bacterium]
MSRTGTDAYRGLVDLPPLVGAAARVALEVGFPLSCLPSHGRLLQLLAGGVASGTIERPAPVAGWAWPGWPAAAATECRW